MHTPAGVLTPRRIAWLGAAALSFGAHLWWLNALAVAVAVPVVVTTTAPRTSAAGVTQPVLLRSARGHEPQPPKSRESTHDADVAAAAAPTPATTPAQAPHDPAARQGPFDEHHFLPRSALSVVPHALTPVLLTTPPSAPNGRYSAELTLFIDETGQVRRVRVDSAGLLPDLEAQARQAFMTTRFQPGEVDGRPVRARLRVAVEFEALGPARAAGVPMP